MKNEKTNQKEVVKNGFFWRSRSNYCRCFNIIIFIIVFMIYLINQNLLKKTENIFFMGYFNDLLAPILLLAFSNFLLSFYGKELKGKNIYIVIIICSIYWEFITPLYKKNSVCDVLDIIMYMCGASIYSFLRFLIERGRKHGTKSSRIKKG